MLEALLSEQDLFTAGSVAARDIWNNCALEGYTYPDDPGHAQFAAGALEAFEQLQASTLNGLPGKIAAGAQAGAEQLNVEKWHGIVEVLQNADDLGATELALQIEERNGVTILHMRHDGAPVRVRDVPAMTFAFVSTKGDDAEATGRFGVGMKTLGRIGKRLEVHSGVYSFAIEGMRSSRVEPVHAVGRDFFNLSSGDTLLSLSLTGSVKADDVVNWFQGLCSSLLLFLKSVKRFTLQQADLHLSLCLEREDDKQLTKDIIRRVLWDGDNRHVVYQRRVPVPEGLTRAGKATGSTTAIAIADSRSCKGRIYATLPTRIESKMPFAMNAEFDPGTARDSLVDHDWNTWLLTGVGKLAADVVNALLRLDPPSAWYLVPLDFEADCNDPWVKHHLVLMQENAHALIAQNGKVAVNGAEVPLEGLSYLADGLDEMVQTEEAQAICPEKIPVPRDACDDGDYRVVLESFGASLIDLERAFCLFDMDLTAGRSAHWHSALVKLAIDEKKWELLCGHTCFLLEGGGRSPLMLASKATEWLTMASPSEPLKRLNLVKRLASDYRSVEHWVQIEPVLGEQFNFRHTVSSAAYLDALAARTSPVKLSPGELVEVRRLLNHAGGSVSLGRRLGKVIELDAFEFKKGRKHKTIAIASECYLPKAIAKDKNGNWARAAEGVSGLIWASPEYAKSLRGSSRKKLDSDDESRSEIGPRKFLQQLGCDIVPRLTRRASSPLASASLTPEQLESLPSKATRIVDDYASPDLEKVMGAIAKMNKRELAERSVLLYSVLSTAWERDFSNCTKARAEWDVRRSVEFADIPAHWLARAREIPWLMNGKKQPVVPPGMVIGTDLNRAIYGNDPLRIVHGLTEDDAASGLPQALGMLLAPDAREIITQLRELKLGNPSLWTNRGTVLLRALAERCTGWRLNSRQPTQIDGIPVEDFRSYMEQGGLIYLQKHDTWVAPSKLLLGRDIFRGRRLFVSVGGKLETLWKALRIRTVSLNDCADVIAEIGTENLHLREEEAVLVEAFQVAERLLAGADDQSVKGLATLPLWTGDRYHKTRPLFITADSALVRALGGRLKFWQAPFDPFARPRLLKALKVTVLGPESLSVVGCEESNFAPQDVVAKFQRAVTIMKDRLAREDDACYRSAMWADLENVQLFLADCLSLKVSVRLGPDRHFSEVVPVSAHAGESGGESRFYFRDRDAIGRDGEGGRLVASFFDGKNRMQASTLWFWAWSRAEEDIGIDALDLAGDDSTDEGSTLDELASASLGRKSRRSAAVTAQKGEDKKSAPATEPAEAKQVTVQLNLKPTNSLTTVSVTAQKAEVTGGQSGSTGRGLKPEGNVGKGGGSGYPTGRSNGKAVVRIVRGYTPTELEQAGYDVLCFLFNGGDETCQAEIADFRKERGIGSDLLVGVEQVRQWVELKTFACEAPDSITFTRNEFLRAREQGRNFYLAVVSGLAEGYVTETKLYRNPVGTVVWAPSGAVTFGSLGKAAATVCQLTAAAGENASSVDEA